MSHVMADLGLPYLQLYRFNVDSADLTNQQPIPMQLPANQLIQFHLKF
jgi:hypothetical protein